MAAAKRRRDYRASKVSDARFAVDSNSLYMDRKRREIALLSKSLVPMREPRSPRSVAEAIDTKFKLAAALRADRAMQSWPFTETAHPTIARWRSGAFEFSFGYQRADLDVRGPPIYPALRGKPWAHAIYTGAGMSAIASLLTAALQVRGHLSVSLPSGAYSETQELLHRFGDRIDFEVRQSNKSPPVPSNACVLWIDSCVASDFHDFMSLSAAGFDLVVFDTTCFSRGSRRIVRVVGWARRHRIPIALVRSHAKLDCLGIEYGRLGSITYQWNRRDPGHAWMKRLVDESREVIRLFGAAALPSHFLPFAGDAEYHACTARRTAAILRNTRRAAKRLARVCGSGAVRAFQHNLYLTLVPPVRPGAASVWRDADELSNALSRRGLPVKHAGSFGFDFTAVDAFVDPLSQRPVLRIAPGDLPPEIIDQIVDAIVGYWKPYGSAIETDHFPRKRPASCPPTPARATMEAPK